MHSRKEVRASIGLLLIAASASALATACGGGSDSEVDAKGGETSTSAGTSAQSGSDSGGGSKGDGGSGNTSAGSGNESGTKTTAGSGNNGGSAPAGDCEAKDAWTEAVHYVLDVTWEGTTAAESGTGKINIWSRVTYKVNGDKLDVGLHACGSVLPETKLNGVGKIAAGGDKVLIEVQEAVWDAESIPVTMATGKQSGIDVGSDVEFTYVSLLGATMADPLGTWPAAGADMDAIDLEGDGSKGYTATPRKGGGFVLPPTGLGLGGSAPSADKVYLVSRQAMTLKGKRTACDAHNGDAMVTAFDNHVVGCHISGGAECNEGQADFVDSNRMKYKATKAIYEAKGVADDATCAQVRAALPQ